MSAIGRGVRNAFRKPGRTVAVTVMLGLSLAMGLTMAVAKNAVDERTAAAEGDVESLLASIGNTLQVRPAGGGGFGGFGGFNPTNLNQSAVAPLGDLPNVAGVSSALTLQVPAANTTLQSAQEFERWDHGGAQRFSPPVFAIGTDDLANLANVGVGSIVLVAGSEVGAGGDADEAMLGQALADRNGLTSGSTFRLYGGVVTVAGVFNSTSGNDFAAAALVLPLSTLQRVADRQGEVSVAFVEADSLGSLPGLQADVSAAMGPGADVVDLQDQAAQGTAVLAAESTMASLADVSGIASGSLLAALLAAGTVVFFAMYLVVRERRREIGVLKAIGAPGSRVVTQFAAEAVVLTGLALALAFGLTLLLGDAVTDALVASNVADPLQAAAAERGEGGGAGHGGGAARAGHGGGGGTLGLLGFSPSSVDASVGPGTVLLGVAAALGVAIVGSGLPALAIARIRPSDVLRGE